MFVLLKLERENFIYSLILNGFEEYEKISKRLLEFWELKRNGQYISNSINLQVHNDVQHISDGQ